MSNVLYPKYKEGLGLEKHHMTADIFHAVLVDSADYTYDAAHEFLSSVAVGARIASTALTGTTFALGVFNSDDFVWPAVSALLDQAEFILVENHDGNGAAADAARQLVAFLDTGLVGMPVTPNGGDINITIHNTGWYAV